MARSLTRSKPPGDAPTEGLPERPRRPGLVVAAAVATALVIVVLNNLGTVRTTQGFPVPDHTPRPFPTSLVMVHVPAVVGEMEPAASRVVSARRLAPVVLHRFAACQPAGVVTDQDPAAGTRVSAGETVRLVVTDVTSEQLTCPEGVALDVDRALVAGFYDFSRGVTAFPPTVAPPVQLLYQGAQTTLLSGWEAQDADAWQVLPPGGGAGDAVPVLGRLAASAGDYRVDIGPHPLCTGAERSPAEASLAGLRQVVVTPATPRESCVGWWALDLFVDSDTGRVGGANLDVWEP